MAYSEETKTFTTPDYSVSFKKDISDETIVQLTEAETKYDLFVKGLSKLNILDDSKKLDNLATFRQYRAGVNSIFYSIESFGDFWLSQNRANRRYFTGFNKFENEISQIPNFHLLSFNLTSGQVYNLPINFMAQTGSKIVEHKDHSTFTFRGEKEFSASHGIETEFSLELIEILLDEVMLHLANVGIATPTRKKAILWLTYNKFIRKGFSLMSSSFNLHEEATKKKPVGLVTLIHEIIDLDLDPFVAFYALSNEVNHSTRNAKTNITDMPKFGLEEIKNLSGLPQPLVRDVMLPTEKTFRTF